ncbi:MAG: response regulator, partial [Bacteroidetes bacterium]
MKIKSLLAKPYAAYKAKKVQQWRETAVADQQKLLLQLVAAAKNTAFGKEHGFATISTYDQYIKAVPVRDYEQIKHYVALVKEGKENILWPGKPLYFAKTSGTTSGVKYIPISKDSIHNHINTAKTALLCYMAETGNTQFAAGKLIFLSGSPELERVGGVPTGRLSGIVNHHVPSYLRGNQLPSFTTNCINDWEEKLDAIVNETMHQNMTLISGIPPWVQMYFDRLQEKTGKKIAELFPNFSLMVQGGVNFAPYKQKLIDAIGKPIDTIELFPASEGFFAFQDTQTQEGLLLNTQSGIFFEFIPVSELGKDIQFIMISAHGTIKTAVEATKMGAFDFIQKPPDLNRLLLCVRNALDKSQLVQETKVLKRKISKTYDIVGTSDPIKRLKEDIEKVAPTEARVLITGPNGSGKELVCKWIHAKSLRSNKPLIEVNCAAIPSELIESELFGHEKGSFTSAIKQRIGKFEQANGGTLFLDEIGDMSLSAQAKVLRA